MKNKGEILKEKEYNHFNKMWEGGNYLGVVEWSILGFFLLLLIIGLIEWYDQFFRIWHEGGLLLALYVITLLILLIVRVLIRDYAQQYVNLANGAIFIFIILPIAYRFLIKRDSK